MPITPSQLSSILRVKKEFNLINGNITLTDITNWSGAGIIAPDTASILLKLVAPTGAIVYQNSGFDTNDFSSPDFDLNNDTFVETMPQDVLGNYITGTYTLLIKARVSDDTVILPTTEVFTQPSILTTPQLDVITVNDAVDGYTFTVSIDGTEPLSFTYSSNSGTVGAQLADLINNYIIANPTSYWAQYVASAVLDTPTSAFLTGLYNGILGGGSYLISIVDIGMTATISQLPTISQPLKKTFGAGGIGTTTSGDLFKFKYLSDTITYTATANQTPAQVNLGLYNAIQAFIASNPSSQTATEWTFVYSGGNIIATYYINNTEPIFTLFYEHSFGSQSTFVTGSATSTAEVCNCTATIAIDLTVDYATALLTSVDTTNYGPYVSLTRVHTIYPPPISGLPSQTTSATTNVYSNIVTTTWSSKVASTIVYLYANDTYVTCDAEGSKEILVEPDTLCATLCIIKKFRSDFYSKFGKKCSDDMEAAYNLACDEFALAMQAARCGQDITPYVNKIYEITGIDPNCDCGCSGSDYPTPVVPTSIINGTDGTDGITPQFQNTGTWIQVSYDNGSTWNNLFSLASVTGATGPQGPAGTNGTNGTTYLLNSYVVHTTITNSSWESLQSYKLLAGTVAANSDAILIEACFIKNTTTSTFPNTRIRFNSNTVIDASATGVMGNGVNKVRISCKITRTSNTTAKYQTIITDVVSNSVVQMQDCPLNTFAGLDFDGTDYDIECSALSIATGDISLISFSVTSYKI